MDGEFPPAVFASNQFRGQTFSPGGGDLVPGGGGLLLLLPAPAVLLQSRLLPQPPQARQVLRGGRRRRGGGGRVLGGRRRKVGLVAVAVLVGGAANVGKDGAAGIPLNVALKGEGSKLLMRLH